MRFTCKHPSIGNRGIGEMSLPVQAERPREFGVASHHSRAIVQLPAIEDMEIAANRANLVSQGHSIGPVRFAGLTILPISAYPASVQWVSPNGAPLLPHRLLFLGQAGGSTPLYEPALKQVIWLPSDLISVTVSHCPQGAVGTACHPGATRRPAPPVSNRPSSPISRPTRPSGHPIAPGTGPTLPGRA